MTTTLETPVAPSTTRIRDKYDEAIEYLTKHPGEIRSAWREAEKQDHIAHCLFQMASHSGRSFGSCGCLTQIRKGGFHAATPELTQAIREELSIPCNVWDITVHHLPIFAKWQRRLDRELGRI